MVVDERVTVDWADELDNPSMLVVDRSVETWDVAVDSSIEISVVLSDTFVVVKIPSVVVAISMVVCPSEVDPAGGLQSGFYRRITD